MCRRVVGVRGWQCTAHVLLHVSCISWAGSCSQTSDDDLTGLLASSSGRLLHSSNQSMRRGSTSIYFGWNLLAVKLHEEYPPNTTVGSSQAHPSRSQTRLMGQILPEAPCQPVASDISVYKSLSSQ
ncbi:hypothetical protein COO60DRAFT_578288 [Scenedesmus sp. NREL 46B-D3]|nr:hypothetical protein COO60DRAFT_578288 [Scenedesmus sp. NREL 46B-D3]